jgi:hypothetical protein
MVLRTGYKLLVVLESSGSSNRIQNSPPRIGFYSPILLYLPSFSTTTANFATGRFKYPCKVLNFNTRTTPSCPGYTDTTRPIGQSQRRTISSQCSRFVVHFRLIFSVGRYSRTHLLQNSVQYCTTRPCFRKYSSSARNFPGVATVWVR